MVLNESEILGKVIEKLYFGLKFIMFYGNIDTI